MLDEKVSEILSRKGDVERGFSFEMLCVMRPELYNEDMTVREFIVASIPTYILIVLGFIVSVFVCPLIFYVLICHFTTFQISYWALFLIMNLYVELNEIIKKIFRRR